MTSPGQAQRSPVVWMHLVACVMVTFVMGSVHAYSVFLLPLEDMLDENRASISFIYSAALIMITVSVLFGHHLYDRASSAALILLAGLLAGMGLVIAAFASHWWMFLVGYGLIFGLANGFAYGYTLQLSGQLMPGRSGFAMGVVTAGYALGSVIFALMLSQVVESFSVAGSLLGLSLLVLLACLFSAFHFFSAATRFSSSHDKVSAETAVVADASDVIALALAYFCAVFAGLMAIGHAAAIGSMAGSGASAAGGAVVVGVGSTIGGVVAGWMVDIYPSKRLLVGLALMSALSLMSAASGISPILVFLALGLIGFAYGAVIAVYPVAIARRFGHRGPRVYGRVFISWGVAGLTAPWFAGWVYDGFEQYTVALLVAAGIASASAWFASRLHLPMS